MYTKSINSKKHFNFFLRVWKIQITKNFLVVAVIFYNINSNYDSNPIFLIFVRIIIGACLPNNSRLLFQLFHNLCEVYKYSCGYKYNTMCYCNCLTLVDKEE